MDQSCTHAVPSIILFQSSFAVYGQQCQQQLLIRPVAKCEQRFVVYIDGINHPNLKYLIRVCNVLIMWLIYEFYGMMVNSCMSPEHALSKDDREFEGVVFEINEINRSSA